MKKILLTAFSIFAVANAASAASYDILPDDSGVYIKFNNRELVDLSGDNSLVIPDSYSGTDTQGNWGIALISTISLGVVDIPNETLNQGGTIFQNPLLTDLPGPQITAVFGDIQLTSPNTATGGFLDLYWQDSSALDISTSAPDATSVGDYSSGIFLARILFEPGILGAAPTNDCTTTVYTQQGVNIPTGATGVADSYGEIDLSAGGVWADALNGNWFNNPCSGTSDIRFKNSFRLTGGAWAGDGGNVVGFTSDDPAWAFTSAPEPMTLSLLGLGLAGLGVRMRRRTN